MSKLSESRLGETTFAEPAELDIDEDIEEGVRDRAEEVMKSVYNVEPGTNWDAVLDMILHEFEREHEIIADIISGRFIDDAEDRQLDMIGDLWQVERYTGERDEHFRARIKSQLPRHTGRSTINEILNVSATLLQTEKEHIHVEENFGIEPARFDVNVDEQVFLESGIDEEEYDTLLDDVRAGGVRAEATIGEQFTYRSVSEFESGENDPEKAYGGFDDSYLDGYEHDEGRTEPFDLGDEEDGDIVMLETGGPYADRITTEFT